MGFVAEILKVPSTPVHVWEILLEPIVKMRVCTEFYFDLVELCVICLLIIMIVCELICALIFLSL